MLSLDPPLLRPVNREGEAGMTKRLKLATASCLCCHLSRARER